MLEEEAESEIWRGREVERQRERKQIRGLRGRREEDEKVGEEGDRLGASDRARPMTDRPQ